jgi:hypothetical protein
VEHDLFRKPVPTFRDHALLVEHDLFRKPVPTFRDHALSPLLGLELGLERRELGKWRVRVGLTLAPIASVAALDVFGAQLRIAIRPVTAVAWWPIAARRPAIGPIGPLSTLLRPRRAIRSLAALPAILAIGTVVMPAMPTGTLASALVSALVCTLARLCGGAFRNRRCAFGRRLRLAALGLMLPARRPALAAVSTSTGAPYVDEIGLRRLVLPSLGLDRGGLHRSSCFRSYRRLGQDWLNQDWLGQDWLHQDWFSQDWFSQGWLDQGWLGGGLDDGWLGRSLDSHCGIRRQCRFGALIRNGLSRLRCFDWRRRFRGRRRPFGGRRQIRHLHGDVGHGRFHWDRRGLASQRVGR